MDWLSPFVIVVTLLVVAFSVAIGRVRHEPPRAIALNAAGYALFLLGLAWASSIGTAAFTAAGAASLGSLLFTMAMEQSRRSRSRPSAPATTEA